MTAPTQPVGYQELMDMLQSQLGQMHAHWCRRPCDGVCRTTVTIADGDERRYQVVAELPRGAVAPTVTVAEEWSRRSLSLDSTVLQQLLGLAAVWVAKESQPEPGLRPQR